jgi:tetratricopeptide (TPR) repeat protein
MADPDHGGIPLAGSKHVEQQTYELHKTHHQLKPHWDARRSDYVPNSERNTERSIRNLNLAVTAMGAAVALISIALALIVGAGFMEWRRWENNLHEFQTRADSQFASISTNALIAQKRSTEIVILCDSMQQRIAHLAETIVVPMLGDEPTDERAKQATEELARGVALVEAMGGKLTATDYFSQGSSFQYNGDYEQAIAAYDKALQLRPTYAEALDSKGVALGQQSNWEDALAMFDKATRVNPNYVWAWSNRSAALSKVGRYEEALESADKALRLNPKLPDAWQAQGIALRWLMRWAQSLEASERAILLKPDFASAWGNKGYVLVKQGRLTEALPALNKAIAFKRSNANLWYDRAYFYAESQDTENALADLERAIELDASLKARLSTDEDFAALGSNLDFQRMIR